MDATCRDICAFLFAKNYLNWWNYKPKFFLLNHYQWRHICCNCFLWLLNTFDAEIALEEVLWRATWRVMAQISEYCRVAWFCVNFCICKILKSSRDWFIGLFANHLETDILQAFLHSIKVKARSRCQRVRGRHIVGLPCWWPSWCIQNTAEYLGSRLLSRN